MRLITLLPVTLLAGVMVLVDSKHDLEEENIDGESEDKEVGECFPCFLLTKEWILVLILTS